jgi:hypothetical protein
MLDCRRLYERLTVATMSMTPEDLAPGVMPEVSFRLVYVLDGSMCYSDARYGSAEYTPTLPAGAQVIEVAVTVDGIEAIVTEDLIQVSVDRYGPAEIKLPAGCDPGTG